MTAYGQEVCDGKNLVDNTTGEWTNIGEEEPQCAFLEIYPGKVYASI